MQTPALRIEPREHRATQLPLPACEVGHWLRRVPEPQCRQELHHGRVALWGCAEQEVNVRPVEGPLDHHLCQWERHAPPLPVLEEGHADLCLLLPIGKNDGYADVP